MSKTATIAAALAVGAVLGAGATGWHELTKPAGSDHVRVDVITPAGETTTTPPSAPSPTTAPVVVVKPARTTTAPAVRVSRRAVSSKASTVKTTEAKVSTQDETTDPAPAPGPVKPPPGTLDPGETPTNP